MEGESAQKIAETNSHYKFFWKRDDSVSRGVGVLIAEKCIDNVISVVRHSTRLIMLRLLCGKSIINFACVYAPQPGLFVDEKDCFYEQQLFSVAPSETLVILVTLMFMLVSKAKIAVGIMVGWLWNKESGRNENTRSLCCY